MLSKSKAKDEFNIEAISAEQISDWIGECVNIYQGNPSWLDEEDHIDTVNFAKALCSETARLTMDSSARFREGSLYSGSSMIK